MIFHPVVTQIVNDGSAALDKYGDFASTHEAYGVLAEEVAELLDAIRSNDLLAVETEAIQVSAVAMRLAEIAGRPRPNPFAERSGTHDVE